MKETYTRNAQVIKITDGDTINVKVDLGYRIYHETALRLNRINAPELSTANGKKSRDYLKQLIPLGSTVAVKTYKNPEDKYGRYLAEVEIDGVNINDLLVSNGLALYWDGKGTKPE